MTSKKNFHLRCSVLLAGFCTVILAGCAGGGGGGGGSGSPSISTFLDESTSYTYSASSDAEWKARQEYKNTSQYLSDSTIHPYTLIGVNEAYARGLSGSSKTIAIHDKNFDAYTHADFKSKNDAGNITSYGSLTTADNGHGAHVAGIAAADYNSNSSTYIPDNASGTWTGTDYPLLNYSTMGVAYNAALHLSDYTNTSSGSVRLFAAEATADAKTAGAIVQNNSWSYGTCSLLDCDKTIDVFKDYQTDNPGTSDALAYAAVFGDTAANHQTYVDKLNSFQETGVIVFAAGNDTSKEEVNGAGGMPVLFEELAEAWLVVGNLDTSGSTVTESSVTRKGNQCGLAAQFCVYADGMDITSIESGSTKGEYEIKSGTSMAAPMVSGAIALLSEAFPNHTPEQLVDRILASANNDFFDFTGRTSFTGGITHGYNLEYGHGLVDLAAALGPIQTSSMIPPSGPNLGLSNGNINSAKRFDLSATGINLSPAFGDALKRALTGKTAYFFDSMNGGFAFELSSLVNSGLTRKSIKHPIDYIKNDSPIKTTKTMLGLSFMSKNILTDEQQDPGLLMFYPTSKDQFVFAGTNLNIQNALSFSNQETADTQPIDEGNPFAIPFVAASEHGIATGFKTGVMDGNMSIGFFDGKSEQHQLPTNGFIVAYGTDIGRSQVSLYSGTTFENNGLLETAVEGAFAENSSTNTKFAGFSVHGRLSPNWMYNAMTTFGYSEFGIKGVGLLENVNDILSSTFAFAIRRPVGLMKKDKIHFGVSQPLLVESGSASVYVPQLYEIGGGLRFDKVNFALKPSGRQIDYGMGYSASLYEGFNVGIQIALTQDEGHVKSSGVDYSARGVLKVDF